MSKELESEVKVMCNLGQGVLEKGRNKGIAEGMEQGAFALISTLEDLHWNDEEIRNHLNKKGIPETYLDRFHDKRMMDTKI